MASDIVKVFMVSGIIFLLGCATAPDDISSSYVSPIQYRNYDCDQIAMEMERVTRHLTVVHGKLKRRRAKDTKNMTVGMILFWPSLFYIKGDGPDTTEFARLKGSLEALEEVAIQRKCDLGMLPEIPDFKEEPSVFTNSDSSVYHKPDCPKLSTGYNDATHDDHIVEFKSFQEAQKAGGKPCSYCKPKGMTKSQERLKKGG